MDPANVNELRDILSHSTSCMDHQDKDTYQLPAMLFRPWLPRSQNLKPNDSVSKVSATSIQQLLFNPPAVAAVNQIGCFSKLCLPPPVFYSMEPHLCCSFLDKCSFSMALHYSVFPTEESKIAFITSLLSRKASLWITTVCKQILLCCFSFQAFSE